MASTAPIRFLVFMRPSPILPDDEKYYVTNTYYEGWPPRSQGISGREPINLCAKLFSCIFVPSVLSYTSQWSAPVWAASETQITSFRMFIRRCVGMVDEEDSKSFGSDTVWVRVPPPAPKREGCVVASLFFGAIESHHRHRTLFCTLWLLRLAGTNLSDNLVQISAPV